MRVLITGGAGFIGSHLSEQLLALNYHVVGIDNFDPFYDISIKKNNLKGFIDHPHFEFMELDLDDDSDENEQQQIQTCVHCYIVHGCKQGLATFLRQGTSLLGHWLNQ